MTVIRARFDKFVIRKGYVKNYIENLNLARAGQVKAATAAATGLAYDFFRFLRRPLEAKQAGVAFSLTRDESQLVRVALELLVREMPVQLGRRDANVRPEMLLRLA